MKVSGLLADKGASVEVAAPTATIAEVARQLAAHRIGALVVPDADDRVVGIISERDVVRRVAADGPAALDGTVRDAMTSPVTTCALDEDVVSVMATMTERRIRHVPVVDDEGRLAGIISIGDVVKSRVDELERERKELLEYVSAR
jgi:CBS domain-containing protein